MAFFGVIKKIILWSYERGSWQYDLLCVVILAFIFLTPGGVFDKRLRETDTQKRVRASSEPTYIHTAELAELAGAGAASNLRDLLCDALSRKINDKVSVLRFEVDADSEGNIRGYRVWFSRSDGNSVEKKR